MKTRPYVVTLFVAYLLVSTWAAGSAQADAYSAREVVRIHQNRFDTATDLHIKFWQKEDNIEVTDWEVGDSALGAPSSQDYGDQPEPHHSRLKNQYGLPATDDPDNGKHAVDVDWVGLEVQHCTTVRIPFSWVLTDRNTKHVQVEWTKEEAGNVARAKHVPLNGWDVDDPIDNGNGTWTHTVTLWNDEDENATDAWTLSLRNLKFGVMEGLIPLSYEELEGWSAWTNTFDTPLTLAPGQSWTFDITTDWKDGHVLGTYEVFDPTLSDDSDENLLIFEVFDHPTETVGVPAPSSLMGMLSLCATGMVASLRRKRLRAEG